MPPKTMASDRSGDPTFLVSRFAAQHVKVALTGDGGDEIFGGYWSLMDSPRLERFARLPGFVHSLAGAGARALPYSAYGKNFLNLLACRSPLGAYFESTYMPSVLRRELLHPEWSLPEDEDALQRLLSHCLLPDSHAALARQITYFEAKANLAGDMLVKVDRMSMANSLEVRCPMLDHEVAAFGMRLPFSFNVHNGRGKRFLAEAFADRLPREIFDRPKRGFSCPLALWFRGSLRTFLHDHLRSRSFRERGIVSPSFVDHLIGEHERGRRDNYAVLWMLLVLELWLREFSSAKLAPEPAQAVM
jgi:asparagine synthase (glutamine-hydrolysing)